jgi:MinD-like ATPase involved in chromosome partitioning or flagellar assembly
LVLKRDFQLYQNTYNFLMQKRTEAAMAEAASVSFHRIIQPALVASKPISPKRNLILIVFVLMGLITSITSIYIRDFIGGKIASREELEQLSAVPVLGVVRSDLGRGEEIREGMKVLASNLMIKRGLVKGQGLLVTSSVPNEGKSFIAKKLATYFAEIGWKTVLVDCNFGNPEVNKRFNIIDNNCLYDVRDNGISISETIHSTSISNLSCVSASFNIPDIVEPDLSFLKSMLSDLKNRFEIVIIDAPATALTIDAVQLMNWANHNLYIVRANFTKSKYFLNPDLIQEEYKTKNISLVMNDVHKATNFSGMYTGSRYSYNRNKSIGWVGRLKHYIKYYLK